MATIRDEVTAAEVGHARAQLKSQQSEQAEALERAIDRAAAEAERSGPCPDDPDGLHHVGCGCDDSDVE